MRGAKEGDQSYEAEELQAGLDSRAKERFVRSDRIKQGKKEGRRAKSRIQER